MRNLVHIALAASLIAAPATAIRRTPEEELARLLQGLTPGKPVGCINLGMSPNGDTRKFEHTAMAYRQGSTWYVNRFHDDCQSLTENTIVVTRTPSSQLCRGDSASLVSPSSHIPLGACIFDDFTPYTKAR